jgi:hypothetical protein
MSKRIVRYIAKTVYESLDMAMEEYSPLEDLGHTSKKDAAKEMKEHGHRAKDFSVYKITIEKV